MSIMFVVRVPVDDRFELEGKDTTMKKMKPMKKYTAWLLCAAMLLQGTPAQLQAAGRPSLDKTKLTLRVGGRAKLRVNGKRIRKCRYRSPNKKIAAVSREWSKPKEPGRPKYV